MLLLLSADFFQNIKKKKKRFFQEYHQSVNLSNCLDPDQDLHFVDPDLGSNCLKRLSADDKILLYRSVVTSGY